jgi:hypothetical protein
VSGRPRIPTFDALLAAIAVAPSAADLAALLVTARTYFMGNQREQLEAAGEQREKELPDGDALGR